jgi:serine/threonine-protein kinase RsbW
MMAEPEEIEIRLSSDPRWLQVLRAAVGQIGQMAGLDAAAVDGLKLAMDEACANIIRHGYGGEAGQPIWARLRLSPDCLEIRLRDFGRTVPAESIRPKPPDASRPGGLGVHLMHCCMDEVTYRAADGPGMELVMIKRLGPRPEERRGD